MDQTLLNCEKMSALGGRHAALKNLRRGGGRDGREEEANEGFKDNDNFVRERSVVAFGCHAAERLRYYRPTSRNL